MLCYYFYSSVGLNLYRKDTPALENFISQEQITGNHKTQECCIRSSIHYCHFFIAITYDIGKIDGWGNHIITQFGSMIVNEKIDGIGNKIIIAGNENCTLRVKGKLDGSGKQIYQGFKRVAIKGKVDGSGDRIFINCKKVVIYGKKDGLGNLVLCNSKATIARLQGGKVIWYGIEPDIKYMTGFSSVSQSKVGLYLEVEGEGRERIENNQKLDQILTDIEEIQIAQAEAVNPTYS